MDELLNECLDDLGTALQWLEMPYQQRPPSWQIEKCRENLSIVKAYLAAKVDGRTPLKWLSLRTGIYNPLMRAGYQTIESISVLSPAQLLVIPKIGPGCKDEIIKALDKWHQEKLKIPFHQDSHSEP
jgi:DNA-directed RNA polymerase alpha subunit